MRQQLWIFLVFIPIVCVIADEELPVHGSHNPIKEEHFADGEHNVEYDHEAIIGSRSEHDEFDGLTEEEAKRRLGTIIDRMDTNHDGAISEQELVDWVYNSFKSLDAEEAAEYFSDQDTDGDNKVTWDEYLQVNYDMSEDQTDEWEKEGNPEIEHLIKMVKDDRDKFKMADRNQDGALNPEEYQAFYHPWSQPYMHELEVDRTLAELDENKDGSITFKEFIGGEDIEDKEDEIMEEENFKEFDKNSDGKLDRDEIKQWVLPDHMDTAVEESQHLISETDDNGDGELSRDEILNKFKEWVGSAATDYGLQLEDKYHDPQEL